MPQMAMIGQGAKYGSESASAMGPILGAIIGRSESSDDRDAAFNMQQNILNEIQNLPTPELKQAAFEKYKSAGVLSPELESLVQQDPSLLTSYKADPRLKDAQMGALNKLQEMGKGGLQPQDMAALSQIQRQADQDAQAKQSQILQDMQSRGQGGSGNELAARLSAGQAGANRLSEQGMNIGAQASQRALQSLMNAGTLGGQISAQDFGQASQTAAAQDAINRFNAQNKQSVNDKNVNRNNYGQQYNLQQQQQMMNANTGLANQQQMYNNQMLQQQYDDQLRKMGFLVPQTNAMTGLYNKRAQDTQQFWSGIGQGAGQFMSGNGDNRIKTSGGNDSSGTNAQATGDNQSGGNASSGQDMAESMGGGDSSYTDMLGSMGY